MLKVSKWLCVLVAFFGASAAFAQDTGWSISEADGQVSVIRDSKAIYGAEGTRLQIGDVVRTSKAGRAVLVRNKEFVIVPPDEQLRIAKVEGSGPVGQFLEFLDDMLTTDHNRNQRSTTALAAVVKGYDNKPKTSGLSDPALEALQPGANASQDD